MRAALLTVLVELVCVWQDDYKAAADVYLEALEFSPENPELLTMLGLLYLRLGENFRAFDVQAKPTPAPSQTYGRSTA